MLDAAEGHSRRAWSHTSAILAMVHNTHCSDRSKAKSPIAFNPHLRSLSEARKLSPEQSARALELAFPVKGGDT